MMDERQQPYEPRLPDEREAWTAANMLLQEHGSKAKEFALRRLNALKQAGDERGVQTWRLILSRIEVLEANSTDKPHH